MHECELEAYNDSAVLWLRKKLSSFHIGIFVAFNYNPEI